jgi:hypothetical protein
MASGKKRRKEIKQTKLQQQPAGPRKIKDGDRRRIGNAKEAVARKQMMYYEGLPVPEEGEEADNRE